MITGLIVMASSPSGPIGLFKESAATAEMLRSGLDSARTELMKVLGEDLQHNMSVHKLESETPEEIRSNSLATLRQLGRMLREKGYEEEFAEFKAWLLALSRKVAEAANEGGFLGFGGVPVTEAETSALDQIEIALR